MAISDDVGVEVDSILSTTWDITEGTVIPETEDIALHDGGRNLDVVMLYADLEASTALVSYNRRMGAKVIKSFLACCTRLILHNGGKIRSFDGDRVMGIYIGQSKNSSAAKTALNIKWAFDYVLKPKLKSQYSKLEDGSLTFGYSVGIASGEVLAVRAGVRGNNDLLWIGRAANIAAKLSDIRSDRYRSFITEDVYNQLREDVKFGPKKENMWTEFTPHSDAGKYYGSSWYWKPA